MSELRYSGSRMNRRKAAVLSGALGAAALIVAALVTAIGTSAAASLAIAALAAFVWNTWCALKFAGLHPLRIARQLRLVQTYLASAPAPEKDRQELRRTA